MPAANTPPPFAVECACGTWARGPRRPQSQILTCTNCGRPVFVFPASPPPFVAAGASGRGALGPWLRFWLPPAAAALLAVALVGAVIAALVRGYRPPDAAEPPLTELRAGPLIGDRLDAARTALLEGSYRVARQELDAAHALHLRFPQLLLPADRYRQLRQWRPQSGLLADLLSESVGEIFRHSIGLADREWDSLFRERYQGRSVLLDARVFRDAGGHYRIDYQLEAAGVAGVWDCDHLRLFERLPLQAPQRLLFGFRLDAIRRPAKDRWVVTPQPDSGVLITDPLLLGGLSIPVDADILEVLRRQATWDVDVN